MGKYKKKNGEEVYPEKLFNAHFFSKSKRFPLLIRYF